jgi:RHS repeat-associated protein
VTSTSLATSVSVLKKINGLPVSAVGTDGAMYKTTYDALQRKSGEVDPRFLHASIVTYYPGTLLVKEIDDAAGNRVALYGYDSAGRTVWVQNGQNGPTNPGKTNLTEYNKLNQVVHSWGDTVYPVEYGYNTFGERVTMKTFRGGTSWAAPSDGSVAQWPTDTGSGDWTRWTYDEGSGLLAAKYDAANLDGTGNKLSSAVGVTYTYNARGQVATRSWARGTTTTYKYYGDSGVTGAATGELYQVSYSDSTPTVSYSYNRMGQVATVGDYTGTRTLNYGIPSTTHYTELSSVDLPAFYGSGANSRTLTRQYDSVFRDVGFSLGHGYSPSNPELQQTYSFAADTGRFSQIDVLSRVRASQSFKYDYVPNSSLIAKLSSFATANGATNAPFTVSHDYETNRNLLTSLNSKWNGASVTAYDYTYNALGQRYTAKQSGSAFDFGSGTFYCYQYNDRGELTSAADYLGDSPPALSTTPDVNTQLPGRNFAFAFDNLGNRLSSSRTGSGANSTPDTYGDVTHGTQANALNQYSERTNNFTHAAGTVGATDTTVTVKPNNGATITSGGVGRRGQYWDAQVILSNASGPANAILTVVAANAAGTKTTVDNSRTASLPGVVQHFQYDADGNLMQDDVWSYGYDAENRLISMTPLFNLPGYPAEAVTFAYDYSGRRVEKDHYAWNAGQYSSQTYARRYLYDGNNLIAEIGVAGDNSGGGITRSFGWGLDLAGSLSASGGVGALLQVTDHTSNVAYLATYDGNGNVAALLNASTGAVSALYEYSPFGELLRCEGSYAAANPFRFSTNLNDDETGLVYYGARYYNPVNGRFINRDPIGEAGGLNLYGFCGNDSVNGYDVLGNTPAYGPVAVGQGDAFYELFGHVYNVGDGLNDMSLGDGVYVDTSAGFILASNRIPAGQYGGLTVVNAWWGEGNIKYTAAFPAFTRPMMGEGTDVWDARGTSVAHQFDHVNTLTRAEIIKKYGQKEANLLQGLSDYTGLSPGEVLQWIQGHADEIIRATSGQSGSTGLGLLSSNAQDMINSWWNAHDASASNSTQMLSPGAPGAAPLKPVTLSDGSIQLGDNVTISNTYRNAKQVAVLYAFLYRNSPTFAAAIDAIAIARIAGEPGTTAGENTGSWVLFGVGQNVLMPDGRVIYPAWTLAHEIGHAADMALGITSAQYVTRPVQVPELEARFGGGYGTETDPVLEAFATRFANQVSDEIKYRTNLDIGRYNHYNESGGTVIPGPMYPPGN